MIYLIDASVYVFRAWHSMPNEFFDSEGHPVNAVHGYTRFLCELLERAHVALVPGDGFGAPGYLRLSYAASIEKLDEGIRRLTKFFS